MDISDINLDMRNIDLNMNKIFNIIRKKKTNNMKKYFDDETSVTSIGPSCVSKISDKFVNTDFFLPSNLYATEKTNEK